MIHYYRTLQDDHRFRVYQLTPKKWTFDKYSRTSGFVENFTSKTGDNFTRLSEVRGYLEDHYGKIYSLSISRVSEGWTGFDGDEPIRQAG